MSRGDETYVIDKDVLGKVFGAGVRRYRKDRGMKQDTLAELTQISRPRVSQIENGCLPPFDKGVGIAHALGVSVDTLLQPLIVPSHPVPHLEFLTYLATRPMEEQWALLRLLRTLLADVLRIVPPEPH